MPYRRQCRFWHRCRSSSRLPLQMSKPCWLQYRQIASWTNRGKMREARIELPGVDLAGDQPGNDFGAAAWPVAAGAVRVGSLEPAAGSRSGAGNCGPGYRPQSGARRLPATSGERQRRRSECRTAPWPAPCRKRRRRCATAQSGQCALAPAGLERLDSFAWSRRSSIQPTRSPSATSRMNRYRL